MPTPNPTRNSTSIIQYSLASASTLYGLALTAFLLARRRLSDRRSWVVLGNSFLHLLLLPVTVLLPLALRGRRWGTALSLLTPALTFLREYGIGFLPGILPRGPQALLPGDHALTLLTYNIHAEQETLAPIIALIRAADADVVALQELPESAARCFDAALADLYPYRALHSVPFPNAGQGVLSKYPITADAYWQHKDMAVWAYLGHQRVEIAVHDARLTLYNAHPVHPGMALNPLDARPREFEITDLLARIALERGPLAMVGDFNMTDQADDYRRIRRQLADSFREAGRGFGWTFPDLTAPQTRPEYLPFPLSRLPLPPLARLDYIFHNGGVRAIRARVWPGAGGSDHRPVLATLAIQPKQNRESS